MSKTFALSALSLELVLLVVTGVGLYFVYRPSSVTGSIGVQGRGPDMGAAGWLRAIHQVTSWATVLTAVVSGALLAFFREGWRRGVGWVLGAGLAVIAVAASVTGYLLPWDQLALRAVTVGANVDGYEFMRDDTVIFVILDGVEISTSTLLRWLSLHALVLGPALIALTAFVWRRSRAAPAVAPPA